MWGRGTAPTIPSTGWPSLKRSIVGIDVIRNRSAGRDLRSTFSYPRRRVAACARETCSRIGATRWHGPHHSAQKSTRRRPGFWICESKVASVSRIGPEKATVTGFDAEAAMSSRSFRARIAASSGSSTEASTSQHDKRVCRGLAGDLRHRPEFLGQWAQQADFASDEGDLALVEGGRVERDEEDCLPHRDGLVQVMQEREDGPEIVVGHQVLEAIEQDDRVLANPDEV